MSGFVWQYADYAIIVLFSVTVHGCTKIWELCYNCLIFSDGTWEVLTYGDYSIIVLFKVTVHGKY